MAGPQSPGASKRADDAASAVSEVAGPDQSPNRRSASDIQALEDGSKVKAADEGSVKSSSGTTLQDRLFTKYEWNAQPSV